MKTIAISGASGFVGQSLVDFFSKQNYKVVQIKRDILNNSLKLDELINSSDVVINLSGANIINRWSESYKKLLISSRLDTTKKLVESLNRVEKKDKLFISTSAVGIYDNKAKYESTKVAIFRFGIVLGKNGGAFQKMITPFKLGLGGIIGSGKQHFSYIHIEDLIEVYKFVIENSLDGVFNCTAPTPTTNYEFTKTLGRVLNRPTIFPIPEFVLKLIFSEGAKVLTDGQSVIPKRLVDLGFNFKYKNIDETLKNLAK